MIVPLVSVLEMLDDSLVEAGYDLGGNSSQWFTERIHTPFITRFNRAPGSAFGFVLLAAPSLAVWMGLKLGGQSCPVHSEHVRSLCKPLLPSPPVSICASPASGYSPKAGATVTSSIRPPSAC
ncbi:ABC transporter permease [Verminephrobacter eiseniae]|uniref:hypothetical protein n=1 Tax=Verminephrobacter eiseniae TaxID=364317 RepID=UPI0022432A91|nr:hypothetical protein [Verminephrobacter eiseniae]